MNTVKSAPNFTACEHWGKGGQYVFDTATGLRTRVGAPAALAELAAEPALAAPVADNQVAEQVTDNKKGKQRG